MLYICVSYVQCNVESVLTLMLNTTGNDALHTLSYVQCNVESVLTRLYRSSCLTLLLDLTTPRDIPKWDTQFLGLALRSQLKINLGVSFRRTTLYRINYKLVFKYLDRISNFRHNIYIVHILNCP